MYMYCAPLIYLYNQGFHNNMYSYKTSLSYSDPYVKISILGEDMSVYPHFVLLDDDRFPQVYKTSVVSKVTPCGTKCV